MAMVCCENCGAPKGITQHHVASLKPLGILIGLFYVIDGAVITQS
jgi:hypothetical protein